MPWGGHQGTWGQLRWPKGRGQQVSQRPSFCTEPGCRLQKPEDGRCEWVKDTQALLGGLVQRAPLGLREHHPSRVCPRPCRARGSPLSSIYSRQAQCRPSREGPGQTSAEQQAPWAGTRTRCTERVSGEPLEGAQTPSRREQGARWCLPRVPERMKGGWWPGYEPRSSGGERAEPGLPAWELTEGGAAAREDGSQGPATQERASPRASSCPTVTRRAAGDGRLMETPPLSAAAPQSEQDPDLRAQSSQSKVSRTDKHSLSC